MSCVLRRPLLPNLRKVASARHTQKKIAQRGMAAQMPGKKDLRSFLCASRTFALKPVGKNSGWPRLKTNHSRAKFSTFVPKTWFEGAEPMILPKTITNATNKTRGKFRHFLYLWKVLWS